MILEKTDFEPPGGKSALAPMPEVETFLRAVFENLPQGARPWVAGFRCDPYHPEARWGGCPVNGRIPDIIETEANNYLAVSSFRPGEDGKIHRRKANFAALHLVMVDDVGTKVPIAAITLEPSYLLETSPGNYQAGYLLSEPVADRTLAESTIAAMVAQGLATDGKDPGMKGVTRYGRLPLGINNKPALVAEHGRPFEVRLAEWDPARRYTIEEIIGAYKLKLGQARQTPERTPCAPPGDDPLLQWLTERGRVQGPANAEGWAPISCPWVGEHTGGADTGAAYLPPGGFKCHHGHCESRNIHDLRAWAKRQGWAREEDVDPDLATRCGIGPEPNQTPPPDAKRNDKPGKAPAADLALDEEFIPIGQFIASQTTTGYLVKKVLPASGLGQVFGNSHAGKSFVLIDLACHLALGWDWHGYRVKKTAVLYIAAEGIAGLKLRFAAWFKAHNVAPPPNLRIRAIPAQLTAQDAAVALRERMNRLPEPPGAVFVDTLATNFGPGNENDAEDMNAAIAGLKTLMGSGLLLSAHHTGHADKTRGRGHSSLFAALDVELHVTQDENRIIRVGHTKLRDGNRLETIATFALKKVPLPWADEDGEPLDSAVLVKAEQTGTCSAAERLPAAQRIALDALRAALVEHGIDDKGVVSVAEDQWRQAAYAAGISSGDTDRAKRQAFQRARLDLIAKGVVSVFDGRYWIPDPRGTNRNKPEHVPQCSAGESGGVAEQTGTSSFKDVPCSAPMFPPPPAPYRTERLDEISSHLPGDKGNGGDESAEALALRLANQAGLDSNKMMAGDLDDEGWRRLANASAELGARYPDDKARLATMMEAIDKAGAARGAP